MIEAAGHGWRHVGRSGPTVRAALLVGFGVTLGIWLFVGYSIARRFDDVDSRAAAINVRYIQAQERLSTIRAQILVGSVFVRDALLDPDPGSASEYRRRFEDACDVVDSALQQYVPVLDTDAERGQLAELRREISDFRATMSAVLASDSRLWPRDARTLLRSAVMPKREHVIGMTDGVQALNRSAYVHQQTGVTDMYASTERRIWEVLGLALAASFGVGLLSSLYAGRLERRLRAQSARDLQSAEELQHLSARLITAQEEERRTIARELHDEVGQVLTAIKVELAVAQQRIGGAANAAHVLDDARVITEGALVAVRDLSQLLHPPVLDDLGLVSAVDGYLRTFSKRHNLRVELLQDGFETRLAADVETSAYRIVQEAMTNVAKHARATSCRVYLQRLQATVLITIEDDGVGFDPTAQGLEAGRRGLGLIGIRERAMDLGGTMRIESTPGHGARVTVELPARHEPLPEGTPTVETIDAEDAHPVGG